MDRGMVSEETIAFLKSGHRRYVVGTPKPLLKRFERELMREDWHEVREGVEVKLVRSPAGDEEQFILCRIRERLEKDRAILRRFEERIEERLKSMAARCERRRRGPQKVEREVGRVLGQNTRAARLFDVRVEQTSHGRPRLCWTKREELCDWATLSAGCYLLRTNCAIGAMRSCGRCTSS